eukprot:1718377-Rhodomonas_salina.1
MDGAVLIVGAGRRSARELVRVRRRVRVVCVRSDAASDAAEVPGVVVEVRGSVALHDEVH